jgi:hypothetical protein
MLLRLLLLVVTELLEGFKRLIEKEQPHTATIDFLNNNGVPLFLPVSVYPASTNIFALKLCFN